MGPIGNQAASAEIKQGLLAAVSEAEVAGMSVQRACEVLELPRRRTYRWRKRGDVASVDAVAALTDKKRGPEEAPHRLLPEEKAAVLEASEKPEFSMLSGPKMATALAREGVADISGSTVYRVLKAAGRTGVRRRGDTGGRTKRPDATPTGPNEVWRFDFTYIRVALAWMYVVFIVDAFSRKIVGWRLTPEATQGEIRKAFDQALLAERRLEPGAKMPTMVSDRGPQMRAKSLRQFFRDLGAVHLFSRPHVPTDNAIAEATIGTFKMEGPGGDCFPAALTAENEIGIWVARYNGERLHGGIGYVTPEEEHMGLGNLLREARRRALREARARRLATNRANRKLVCLAA